MKAKLLPLLLLLFSPAGFLFSQTGVFWFGDSTSSSVNNRIISIKENPDGGLFLLGKASDRDYKNIHPWWAVTDKSGKLTTQKTVATTNQIYDLANFTVCEKDKVRIWGTETVNNRLTILLNTIDLKGELPGSDMMMTNTTTLCGDVYQLDADNAILAKTVQSSRTGKFHISLYQYNVKTDAQQWYKTLDSELNEECTKIFVMKDGSIILLGKLYNEERSAYTSLLYKLSSTGEIVWRKDFEAYNTFFNQGISEGKDKSLIYVCSTGSEKEITGSTKIYTIDADGNASLSKELNNIRANGILTLKSGKVFVYGSHMQKTGNYIITKASYKLFDAGLKNESSDELGMMDGPDAFLPSLAMTAWPSSSDFLTAIQLADGRIACGGRVYMPEQTAPDKIIKSARTNKALLVLMNAEGKFRN